MAYDFVFANAQRFDTPSETLDNALTMDAPSAVVTAFADALSNGGRLPLVLASSAVIDPSTTFEVVYVIGTGSGKLTITRGEEGTTPQTWPVGTVAQNALTSGALNELPANVGRPDVGRAALATSALLDVTVSGDQTTIDVPDGFWFIPWFVNMIKVTSESVSNIQVNLGITNGGSEIKSLSGSDFASGAPLVGFFYTFNGKLITNDKVYVTEIGGGVSATEAKLRFVVEGTLIREELVT